MPVQWTGGFYACQAADADALNGRCRRNGWQDNMCHEGGHEKSWTKAMPPKTVMVNFSLSERMLAEARRAGFQTWVRIMDETQARHRLESCLTGRPFAEYRPVGDTGAAVFGREGLRIVSGLQDLRAEIEGAGIALAASYIQTAPSGGGGRLVTVFRHPSLPPEEGNAVTDPMTRFLDDYFSRTWAECHIWDNPPRWHATVTLGPGEPLLPIQFHILRELEDGGALVQVIKPRMEAQLELPAEVRKAAYRATTSTANLKGPVTPKAGTPLVQPLWNSGWWDALK